MKSALGKWSYLFEGELLKVDKVILDCTKTETTLITNIISHIVSSGGKRLRPVLTVLSSKLCDYNEGSRHINLAAAIEFLHTATLLHDDVVDESDLRRGSDTANNIWGNAASVLVGDFLLGRAFQLMSRDGSLKVLEILSDTSATITEGEVKQLMAANDISTDENQYTDIISSKTAQLFAAACRIGAVISEKSEKEEMALESFGKNLGIAFQIADDALDYSAKQEELGKVIGDDFREGKVTLPVILSYQAGNDEERKFWNRVIAGEQNDKDLEKAISLIKKYDVLEETINRAKSYSNKAVRSLDIFDECSEKSAMLDLLEFSVNRPY